MSWASLKKAVNSTIGNTGFKALDEMLGDGIVPIVKSIQHGTVLAASANAIMAAQTVAINTVNPNKALCLHGIAYTSRSNTSRVAFGTGNAGYSITANTLTLNFPQLSVTEAATAWWIVVEFY